MKFGANVERLQDNELGTSTPNGQFTFTSLANFLTDKPTTFTAALAGGNVAPYNIRQTIVGAYFEDDAHLASNFTANLGLRYEMATVPTEVNGRLTNLRNIGDGPLIWALRFSITQHIEISSHGLDLRGTPFIRVELLFEALSASMMSCRLRMNSGSPLIALPPSSSVGSRLGCRQEAFLVLHSPC